MQYYYKKTMTKLVSKEKEPKTGTTVIDSFESPMIGEAVMAFGAEVGGNAKQQITEDVGVFSQQLESLSYNNVSDFKQKAFAIIDSYKNKESEPFIQEQYILFVLREFRDFSVLDGFIQRTKLNQLPPGLLPQINNLIQDQRFSEDSYKSAFSFLRNCYTCSEVERFMGILTQKGGSLVQNMELPDLIELCGNLGNVVLKEEDELAKLLMLEIGLKTKNTTLTLEQIGNVFRFISGMEEGPGVNKLLATLGKSVDRTLEKCGRRKVESAITMLQVLSDWEKWPRDLVETGFSTIEKAFGKMGSEKSQYIEGIMQVYSLLGKEPSEDISSYYDFKKNEKNRKDVTGGSSEKEKLDELEVFIIENFEVLKLDRNLRVKGFEGDMYIKLKHTEEGFGDEKVDIILELDGPHHDTNILRDARKDRWWHRQGGAVKVLRCTYEDTEEDLAALLSDPFMNKLSRGKQESIGLSEQQAKSWPKITEVYGS